VEYQIITNIKRNSILGVVGLIGKPGMKKGKLKYERT
jgi:hypothetical protein